MLAHGIVNQFDPANPLVEQRADQTLVLNMGEYRQCMNPTTHDITFEVKYDGNWYVVRTDVYATDSAAAAAGTYALSTIS